MVLTILKNISQWGSLIPIYAKIKNVPNHQPAINCHLVLWLSYLHGHSTPEPQVPVVPQKKSPAFCGGSRTFQWPPCTDASKRAPWSCSCYTFFTTWSISHDGSMVLEYLPNNWDYFKLHTGVNVGKYSIHGSSGYYIIIIYIILYIIWYIVVCIHSCMLVLSEVSVAICMCIYISHALAPEKLKRSDTVYIYIYDFMYMYIIVIYIYISLKSILAALLLILHPSSLKIPHESPNARTRYCIPGLAALGIRKSWAVHQQKGGELNGYNWGLSENVGYIPNEIAI